MSGAVRRRDVHQSRSAVGRARLVGLNDVTRLYCRRPRAACDSPSAHPREHLVDVMIISGGSSREMVVLVYTAIFEKNMRNSTVNYLIPDWLTAVT